MAFQRAKREYNLVMLHPDHGSVESWTAEGNAEKMRADFTGWEPRCVFRSGLPRNGSSNTWTMRAGCESYSPSFLRLSPGS